MSRWFRLYDDILDDPKVQMLSPELFKTWVNILAVASKHAGKIPPIQPLAFSLRLSQQDMQSRVEDLIIAGLIDIMPDKSLEPHNWSKRQWKSDDSAERVKRHREKKRTETPGNAEKAVTETKCNDDVTVTVTPPDTDTDTDTDTEIVVVDAQARTKVLPEGCLEKLKAAAAEILDDPMRAFGLDDPSIPLMWLREGCDFELDVLPAVKRVAQTRRGKSKINHWNYFTQAVSNAKAERERGLPAPIEIAPRSVSTHPYYAEKEAKSRAWREALAQVQ